MKKDGRKLSHEVSEYLRIDAVRRVESGESPRAVIDSLGLCRTTIYRWIRAAKKRGLMHSKPKNTAALFANYRRGKNKLSVNGSAARTRVSTDLIMVCGRGKLFNK